MIVCPRCKGELYRTRFDLKFGDTLKVNDIEVIYGFELFTGCEYKSHCCGLRWLVAGRLSTREGWIDMKLTKESV